MDAASLGAAAVAGELLAFYREPARRRPPYLHHEVAMPDGQVVFRLALGRFPHGWLRDLPAREREEVRVAAAAFVRQVCLWERATHYQVLCIDPDASRDSVKDHYHLLIALIHPDRQEPGSAWPTGCAQRANQAYEVLADEARRAEYDTGLLHSEHGAAADSEARAAHVSQPARGRRPRFSAASFFKRLAVFAGVVAGLFLVQAWWMGGGESPQHSLLERAMPASARWMREVLPDTPRFLSTASAATAFEPGDPMQPLKEPRRLASLGTWVPMPEASREASPALSLAPSLPAQFAAPASVAVVPSAATYPARAPAESAPPAVPAPPVLAAPAAAPVRLAQATPSRAPVAPSRDQIELLVAMLVGYYDSGDAEQLIGLVDPDRLGWFGGFRLRGAYTDFFAATRSRRLRMERIAWEQNGSMAQARGEATVLAEYADGRPRLERRVPVELDIALRDGQARITRLVLYPGAQ